MSLNRIRWLIPAVRINHPVHNRCAPCKSIEEKNLMKLISAKLSVVAFIGLISSSLVDAHGLFPDLKAEEVRLLAKNFYQEPEHSHSTGMPSASGKAPGSREEILRRHMKEDESRLIDIFKHLHQNPELGFTEAETAAFIEKQLKNLGYQVSTGIAHTGIVAILENGSGPTIALRSDMDALPIKETTGLPYASKAYGKDHLGEAYPLMHACGHDAHMTWLLAVAKYMSLYKDQWQGTLVLVAQPAEELLTGAVAMVKDGLSKVMPRPDVLVAAHVIPLHPAGTVALESGHRMAATTNVDVTIHGVGGHGSTPRFAIDPVVMGSMAVMGYQTIMSRTLDQTQKAVLTVGAFNAGNLNNVIPDSARLRINLRWYNRKERDAMVEGIKRVTNNVAKMFNVPGDKMPEINVGAESYPVINPEEIVSTLKPALISQLGAKRVVNGMPPVMGSEDFIMLATAFEGVETLWMEVGSAPATVKEDVKKGIIPVLVHNPNFKVELEAIITGAEALSATALHLFKVKREK